MPALKQRIGEIMNSKQMKKIVISTRVKPELVTTLDALCEATERDRSYHVERALKEYVQKHIWHVGAVQEGIQDAEAGRLVPLDTVKEKWEHRSMKRVSQ